MTREEAIINLEKLIALFHTESEQSKMVDYSKIIETLEFAAAALRPVTREQVKKMRGKWIDARYSSKDVPQCQCSICGKKYIGLETDFCQYCGAPMTDKAVEILMKRLEKMHETI